MNYLTGIILINGDIPLRFFVVNLVFSIALI